MTRIPYPDTGEFSICKIERTAIFYGHKQNRFWKVLAGILGYEVPQTIEEKKEMLLANHIAVWDVIQSCEIEALQMPVFMR